MKKDIVAHRVYIDEKYNKPYVRIYRIINGKSYNNYDKFTYKLPNRKDYRYINGLTNGVEMACSKFKEFRKLNNIKISECEYCEQMHDDSFYYNSTKQMFFIKVNKKIYESLNKEDVIFKYSFYSIDRKLRIKTEEVGFNTLVNEYEQKQQEIVRKRKVRAIKKLYGVI